MRINQKGITLPIIGVFVLLLVVGAGGYYFATRTAKQTQKITTLQSVEMETKPTPTSSATTDTVKWQSYNITKLPETFFLSYSLEFPSSWRIDTEERGIFRLTKDSYEIAIDQNGPHGYDCIFEGTPDGPERDLRNIPYIQFDSEQGIWRRFEKEYGNTNPKEMIIDLCIKTNSGFDDSSDIGSISYSAPRNNSQEVLKEMDEIVKTIKPVR